MKDIGKRISKDIRDEIVWDEPRYKVILFRNDFPISYVSLNDDENTMEKAMEKASVLLKGGGIKLADN